MQCSNMQDDNYAVNRAASLGGMWKVVKEFIKNGWGRGSLTLNPTWLLAGEEKMSNPNLVKLLEECWGNDPVYM